VRLPDCPAWCQGLHDPNDPLDLNHYAPRPKPIRVRTIQPNPLTPFRTVSARRSIEDGIDRVTIQADDMYDHVLLTRSEARKLRDQITTALNTDTTEAQR
jgi:hypothetical protein